jgi:nucleoside-triphosphatase
MLCILLLLWSPRAPPARPFPPSHTSSSHVVLLLTGVPGAGKTTVIRKLAGMLSGWRLAGFYTEEIRICGTRLGFRIQTFDREERVMAHVDFPGPERVGRYGVDVAAIDALAESALAYDDIIDAYLVDEIGKMECLSQKFTAAMGALLDSGKPIVATVALQGGGFIAHVKAHPGTQLWEVTRENRDDLPRRAMTWLARG